MANLEKFHTDTYPNRKSPYESVEEPKARKAEALDSWFTGLVWSVMAAFLRTTPRTLLGFPILKIPSELSTKSSSCWSSGPFCFSRSVRPGARAIIR